jgi:hypothetical protein
MTTPASRTAPSPDRRTRTAVRGVLAAMAVLALGGVVYVLATTPPTPDSFYPKCMMYQATGLHCPGCGTGRATHAALNGRFLQAFAFNPFAVVLLPAVAVAVLVSLARWVTGRLGRSGFLVGGRWVLLLAVALVLFTVLRNIPVEPFTLLAPHEL